MKFYSFLRDIAHQILMILHKFLSYRYDFFASSLFIGRLMSDQMLLHSLIVSFFKIAS